MDQRTFLEIAAMMNAFPQGSSDPDVFTSSVERSVRGLPPEAVAEAAQRFMAGLVEGQHKTFAPSVAEFATEARRIAGLLPYRNRPRLPPPKVDAWAPQPPEHRVRMGFKMALLSEGISRRQVERVKDANERGLEDLIALGQEWKVPVPDELWDMVRKVA